MAVEVNTDLMPLALEFFMGWALNKKISDWRGPKYSRLGLAQAELFSIMNILFRLTSSIIIVIVTHLMDGLTLLWTFYLDEYLWHIRGVYKSTPNEESSAGLWPKNINTTQTGSAIYIGIYGSKAQWWQGRTVR